VQATISQALEHFRGGQFQQAQRLLQAALEQAPDHPEALHLCGAAHCQLGDAAGALPMLRRSLALRPDHLATLYNLAVALEATGALEESQDVYTRALAIKPDLIQALTNRGNVNKALRRLDAAVADYDAVLARHPGQAPLWANRGVALHELRRYPAAVASYDKVLELAPQDALTWSNRGNALRIMRQFADALGSYERALALAPDMDYLLDNWLHTKLIVCDWDGIDSAAARLFARVAAGERAARPFSILSMTDDPGLHRDAARYWVDVNYGKIAGDVLMPRQLASAERLRIGYFSADFHDHATAQLMARLFEIHDRERFEIVAFSFGPAAASPMRMRLEAAFDRFVDISDLTDEDAVTVSRQLGIDIAVDLKGFTHDARFGLFQHRCAPVQVNYLGHPGSLGASAIDYIIADPVLIPPGDEVFYSEQVVRLPDSYQVNDPLRSIAGTAPARAAAGLPEQGFVFCCFNNNYKIRPEVFARWMRILAAVPGSVLWLFEDNPLVAVNLRRAATSHGIAPERLVFAPRLPAPEHLARHRLADLFLDTLPYNAHTTASDALWAGLPVLTCTGRSFASRVAASLLTAVGLPELITSSGDDYEALAIALARDPLQLGALRERLAQTRDAAPLFDCARFARHLEAAYLHMQARAQAGLPPATFDVQPRQAQPS